jgi:glycerol uptake facilitator-like aquaporin
MEEEEEEGVAGRSFNFRSDVCDLWYRKENALYRRLRIVFIEFLTSLWYNTIVGIGFRMLGNSWSFGLLQGFVFASMVGLFWYEDFGFANIFVAMGLCFMRQLRSREYWIFFLHLIGHLLGTTLAMAGIVLVTNDLPGLQTFGTPTKSTLISETAAGFAEFIGSFFVAFLIFVSVLMWNESVRVRFAEDYEKKEKKRQKRHYKMPGFTIVLGLAYTALSIGFYDLTGSSFNFLRWAVPRLCMGRFDLNPRDALYYLVANFIAVALAGAIAYLLFFCKQRVEKTFVKKLRPSDGIPLV